MLLMHRHVAEPTPPPVRPPVPEDEATRLSRLRELVVLDTSPEPLFDSLARMASEVCGVPIALMSLIDEERQWFKANVGLPGVNETARDIAFCAHAILDDDIFEVPDATEDSRFSGNPLVTGAPHIRFYAGAPLILSGGGRIGTLCVIDRQARRLTCAQTLALRHLAKMATQALEMRRDLITKSLLVRAEFEQAVLDNENRYRALVENHDDLVSLARSDGRLVLVNPACARHVGCSPAEAIGRSLFEFVAPDDADRVRERLAEVLRTGDPCFGESRMVAGDGADRWFSWTHQLHRDASGEAMLHSVGRDVTDRKQAEMALRSSQTFLMRTGRVAGVGGWELELASGRITWSQETRRIHGVDESYVPTLASALEFYAPDARPLIEGAVKLGMESGVPWDLELPFVTAKGTAIWVRAVGEVEFDGAKPVRLVGAFQDITERKQLELRVAENERFLRQITDSVPLRMAYIDKSRRYRFVNQAHCDRFGRGREKILGLTRSEATGREPDADIEKRISAVLGGEAQRYEFEELLHGKLRRIENQLTPDVDECGAVRGFYSTGIDITDRWAAERSLRELTTIVENTTDYVVQADWQGDIVYMNPAARALAGLASGEAVGRRNFAEFNTPATNALFAEVIVGAVKATGVWVGETRIYGAGRREVPVSHMVLAHRDATGRVERYSAVMRDITAEIASKHELERQAATLRSVAEAIPASMAVVGTDGRYRFVNSSFERWTGANRESIVGRTLVEVLGRVEYERSRPWIERVCAGESVAFEKAYTVRGRETHLAISYVPLWLGSDRVDGFISVAQDVTSHRLENVRLFALAQHDALTGLLNRAGFEEHMKNLLDAGAGPSLALLCIDLDHFKPVNDQHGHPVGDHVLRTFAQRLSALVRPTDAVARLGGDEFAIALTGVRLEADADTVADKVVAAASAAFEFDGLTLRVGASVGVAFAVDPQDGWQGLLARADAMLYRAKGAGRGRRAVERRDLNA